jgi:hypothetical protein
MALILAAWSVWWLVFTGVGLLVRRLFGLRALHTEDVLLCFWVGWSCAILGLQLWHLWFRIDERAQMLIAATGLGGLIWSRSELLTFAGGALRRRKALIAILLGVVVWLANRSIGPIQDYDTGLYHLSSVAWAREYPIIPGLGNLNGRLAFNSSFFLYAALLDVGWLVHTSQYIANELLVCVLLIQVLYSFWRLIFKSNSADPPRRYYHFLTLLLAPLLVLVFGEYRAGYTHMSSLSPDLSVLGLGSILSAQLLLFTAHSEYTGVQRVYDLFCIVLLASVGITIKLSFAALGLSILGIATAIWLLRCGRAMRTMLLAVSLPAAALLLPWMIRGVLLSGYIAYPSTIGAFDFGWRVPRFIAINDANIIMGWARKPRVHWATVLDSNDWFWPWWSKFIRSGETRLVIVAGVLAGLMFCFRRNHEPRLRARYLFLIPLVASIVIWFFLAPDMRFAGASFWALAAGLCAVAAEDAMDRVAPSLPGMRWAALVLSAAYLAYIWPFRTPVWYPADPQSAFGLHPPPQIAYRSAATASGLVVHVPESGDQCWSIPLPCAPYFRPDLHLREPTQLSAGMAVTASLMPRAVGFIATPDIGVQEVSGWYAPEAKLNIRWMKNPGKMLLYTEKPVLVQLSLKPYVMNVDRAFGRTGQLILTTDERRRIQMPVESEMVCRMALPLHEGFNILTFELLAGNFVPKEHDPNNNDTRELSIAFYPIEVATLKLLDYSALR